MALQVKGIDITLTKVFLCTALIATIGGALFATKTLSSINKNIAAAKEAARPADIKIMIIATPDCADCFNIKGQIEILKKQNVFVGEEKSISFDSDQARSLIKELGITRVPTYVVTGEVNKKNLETFVKSNGEVKNNTFVFTKVAPIFLDPETKKEFGKVIATILTDSSCPQCFNPKPVIESYKKAGIKITDTKEIPFNSFKGQSIIGQYKITKVPTFILSSDIDFYDSVKNSWSQIGTIEQDKTYIVRNMPLPYRDLGKSQVLGLVDVIYLIDSTCSDCYKAQEVHKDILTKGFGVGLRSERTVDMNTSFGKELVNKYKITQVPTVLISPEVGEYINLKSIWNQIGTIESNNWYVFRQSTKLGGMIYKDLTSNKIIRPQQQTAP